MRFIKQNLFVLGLGFGLIFFSCKKESKSQVKPIKIEFRKDGDLSVFDTQSDSLLVSFSIEIADDEYERQRGLMDRPSMKEDNAMLFIFPESDLRSFYMKSTFIPLDIIYIGSNNTIVSFQKNAKPLDESSLPSNAMAKYVLEINGGLADRYNIKTGDSISYTRIKN